MKVSRRVMLAVAVLILAAAVFIGHHQLSRKPPETPEARERIPHNQDAMPGPALSPEEALQRMTVPEGFTVELVASEPEIVNPVAMAFDERGRIWITESLEYPRKEPGPGRDRIKILEDSDGDGRADRITIFAEGLNIPSGIALGHGGVWVANSPDILFLRDTDGDGKADLSEVVVTGFGREDTHELPNSLTWGPDGYLYGLNGVFNPSRVSSEGKTWEFTAAIFRIDPRTRRFEIFAEGTSNPWGLAFDPDGNLFISACVVDHLWHITESGYYHRQSGAYPPFTWKLGSIVDHKHYKAAYCGLVYHDSDAFPEPYRGRLYMGNIHGNSLNTDRLEKQGSTYAGREEPDLLQANDAWFMPVSQKTGPDGSLYVLDWYDRYHCYQDARRDPEGVNRDKGRLYRIRYRDTPRAPLLDLAGETDDQLVERLFSGNLYFRDTAQRLLAERNRPETRRRLSEIALNPSQPRSARLHALWSLVGSGDLETGFHLQLLQDADAVFRAWGVRAAGNKGGVEAAVERALRALAGDPAPEVRLQVVIAAGKLGGERALETIIQALGRSTQDSLIPVIAWQNIHSLLPQRGGEFVRHIAKVEAGRSPVLVEFLSRAGDRMLADAQTPPETIVSLIKVLFEQSHVEQARAVFRALSQRAFNAQISPPRLEAYRRGLRSHLDRSLSASSPWELRLDAALLAAGWREERAIDILKESATAGDLPEERRLDAIAALTTLREPAALTRAEEILSGGRPSLPESRRRVLRVLGSFDSPKTAEIVLRNYAGLEPALRQNAVEMLTQREQWARSLVEALESGGIDPADLSTHQVRRLLEWKGDLPARIRKIVGPVRSEPDPDRNRVISEVRQALKKRKGDPVQGRLVFQKVCAACHEIYGEGAQVGPDLTRSGRGSLEQLLSNIFDPNLVIGAGYQSATAVTRGGRVLSGMLSEDSSDRLVIRVPGGSDEAVPRSQVESLHVSSLSVMPEGLEESLPEQELVDLIAFLALDRAPDHPRTRPIRDAQWLFPDRVVSD